MVAVTSGCTVRLLGTLQQHISEVSSLQRRGSYCVPIYHVPPANFSEYQCGGSMMIQTNFSSSPYLMAFGNSNSGPCFRAQFYYNASNPPSFGLWECAGVYVKVAARRGGSAGGKYFYECDCSTRDQITPITPPETGDITIEYNGYIMCLVSVSGYDCSAAYLLPPPPSSSSSRPL